MTQNLRQGKPAHYLKRGIVRAQQFLKNDIVIKLSRWLMELSSIGITLIIIWLGALGVLMNRQTVDLELFKPHYEQWFSGAFSGKTADIQKYTAKWVQSRQAIEIKASDIVITGHDNAQQEIAEVVGEFAINPTLLTTDLIRLSINGGALTIARDEKNNIQIGLGSPDTFKRVGALWGFKGNESRNEALEKIRHIEIKAARIYIRDFQDGVFLNLENVDGEYEYDGQDIIVSSRGDIVSGNQHAPYRANLKTTPDWQVFSGHFDVKDITPANIAPVSGPYAWMAKLDAPSSLNLDVEILPNSGIKDLHFTANVGEGQLKTGKTFKPFTSALIEARYNAPTQHIDLLALEVKSEALNFSASGVLEHFGEAATGFLKDPLIFDLKLDPARINLGQKYSGPINIHSGVIQGNLDLAEHKLVLETVDLDFGSFQTDLSASAARLKTGALANVKIDGRINGEISPSQILGFWPNDFALGGRNWMVRSLMAANFSNLKVRMDLDANDIATKIIANDHLNVRFDVDGVDIRYLNKMPWLKGSAGYGTLQGNQFNYNFSGGAVDGLTLGKGAVTIPRLSPKGGDFTVSMDVMGSIAEMLRVSNFEPLGYADKFGLTPQDFAGQGLLNISVTRPLLSHYDKNRIQFKLAGSFTGAGMPVGFGRYVLNNGALSFLANNEVVEISGPVKFGNWPADLQWKKSLGDIASPAAYSLSGLIGRDDLDEFGIGLRKHFGGSVAISVQGVGDGLTVQTANINADFTNAEINMGTLWNKQKDSAGQLAGTLFIWKETGYRLDNFTVQSKGLSLAGSVALAHDFRLNELKMIKAQIDGFVDASVEAAPSPSGALALSLSGKYLNIEPWVSQAFKSQSSTISIPLLINASIEKMSLNENYHLQDAALLFDHDGANVQQAKISGSLKDGLFVAEIKKGAGEANRIVHAVIPNASHAALAMLGLNSLKNGHLVIDGFLPPSGQEGGLKGAIKLTDFILVNAPVFTQILSLASLQGLVETLSGGDMAFAKMMLNFGLEDGVLKVRSGRASGPALGLTGEGDIDFSSGTLDFNGVLVPSYTVNSVLGDIPILGDIIVGKKGEGMFALNYTVKGPFEKTQINVNPLSALTPGFLRRIFDVKRDKITDAAIEELIKEQKQ